MHLKKILAAGVLGSLATAALRRLGMFPALFSANYLPHRLCYLEQPALVWTNVITDGLIAGSYALIFGCLFWLVKQLRFVPQLRGYIWIFVSFGTFVLACGVTHLMEVVTVWWPLYPLSAAAKVICAAVSIPTAIMFARATPELAGNIRRFLAGFQQAKRAEEDAAANYRGQVEAINRSGMMIEFEMDGTIIKANENYLRTFHYLDVDMAGKHHSVFVTKEYKESAEYKEFWDGLRRGEFQSGLVMRVDKLGNEVWISASYNTIYGTDGMPVKVVKFAANVTDRVRAQRELKDAEARLQAILDNVQDGIITFDGKGTIISVNPAVVKMFKYEAAALVGRNFKMLMPEPARGNQEDDYLAGYESVRTTKPTGLGRELQGLNRLGITFPMELTVTEVSFQGQRMFVGVVRDVTERKRAQDAVLEAKGAAEAANRTKSDFLANMSHEIRTPMNAILGMTHLALRAHPTTQQRGYLTKIGNASQSLLNIMNDILDFSKIEAGKLVLEKITFSLQELWKDLVDIVGKEADQKGIAMAFWVSPKTPPFLIGDPLRLRQILINLVNNAVKFTQSGEILVTVIADSVTEDEGRLRFSVRDTGIGMSPEQVSNLFQAFNQADTSFTRKYGGTGLGLAISKRLCEMMGGSISVESEVAAGSTFVFTITIGIAKRGMPLALPPHSLEGKDQSVLIVEDSDAMRAFLEKILCRNGYATRSVGSGEGAMLALSRASQEGKPFDLVLMDWRLPGINGMDASKRIKESLELSPVPAILMLSAYDRDEVSRGHARSTLDGFLIKPASEAALMVNIANILRVKTRESSVPTTPAVTSLIGRRVLLVEDNEINRDLATELLGDLGITVSIAVNGQEGVARVAEEDFDLVLMDIQMPVMDGLSATRQIRVDKQFQSLPIIAMTAHAMNGDRERSLYAGMNDHLTKPISPSLLTETLLRWMPAKPRVSDQPATVAAQLSAGGEEVLPLQLLPFDIRAALDRANGKPKLVRRMLLSFANQYTNAAATLREYDAEGRVAEAERLAHSLKGIAATLEANDLANAASAVEQAYQTGRTDDLSLLLDRLERELDPAILAVASLQASVSQEAAPALAATEPSHPLVLVVDDQATTFDLMAEALRGDYSLQFATDGERALTMAANSMPDVILLDVVMPGIDGYEVCQRLKASPSTSEIPIIFMTSLADPASETKGLELGGADYITKPFNLKSVRARVDNQIKLKTAQDRLNLLASTDSLTGLANRRRFDEMLSYEYARHARSGMELAIMLLDIDHFKAFNDNYGHVSGDDCLRQIGRAIAHVCARMTDSVARYGGEEFVFLLPETNLQGAVIVAEKIRQCISELNLPHSHSTVADHVTASIGVVSSLCFSGRSASNIVALADQQLYAAKTAGRNQVCGAMTT